MQIQIPSIVPANQGFEQGIQGYQNALATKANLAHSAAQTQQLGLENQQTQESIAKRHELIGVMQNSDNPERAAYEWSKRNDPEHYVALTKLFFDKMQQQMAVDPEGAIKRFNLRTGEDIAVVPGKSDFIDLKSGDSLYNWRTGKIVSSADLKPTIVPKGAGLLMPGEKTPSYTQPDTEKQLSPQDQLVIEGLAKKKGLDSSKLDAAQKVDLLAEGKKLMSLTDPEMVALRKEIMQQRIDNPPPGAGQGRLDRSYQFNTTQLSNLGKAIRDRSERLDRLRVSLDANSPQADALIAPELLTAMAGGQGSGLRMNEAEIARIVGGRSNWESLKASLNRWQLDPSKALSITPAQRGQVRALVSTMSAKVAKKLEILDKAQQDMIESGDVVEHRRILANSQKALSAVESDSGQQVPKSDPLGLYK